MIMMKRLCLTGECLRNRLPARAWASRQAPKRLVIIIMGASYSNVPEPKAVVVVVVGGDDDDDDDLLF